MNKYFAYRRTRTANGVTENVVPTVFSVDGDGELIRWIYQENVEEIDCD